LSFYTSWILVETQKVYGSGKVKSFADLGKACFGVVGYVCVASLFFLN